MNALEVLFESEASPSSVLPAELRRLYGGDLGFDEPIVYANFVASLDGVAADRGRPRSSRDISGGNSADRFIMGLLRASADAVVIGAGTLRAHPGGAWTPEHAYPPAAPAYETLRRLRKRTPCPRLVVVSASGDVPFEPSLRDAIVVTTEAGVGRLPNQVRDHTEVHVEGAGQRGAMLSRALEALRADGYLRILTEGGPRMMGSLVGAGVVDELFLTVSPLLAGGTGGNDRPGIVDGLELRPGAFRPATLLTLRRHDSFLFLRYRLDSSEPPSGASEPPTPERRDRR